MREERKVVTKFSYFNYINYIILDIPIDKHKGQKHAKLFLYSMLGFYGFTISTASFACLAAIPLMLIGDLNVISFTSPVCTVFFDRIISKRLIIVFSICLSLFIVLWDIMVVQPPFIFEEEGSTNNTTNDFLESVEGGAPHEKHSGQYYYTGDALCFYTAAAIAGANVMGAQCTKVNISTSKLMLVSGFCSLILSLISSTFLPNRLLTNPQSLPLKACVLLPISGAITMKSYWTITLAISIKEFLWVCHLSLQKICLRVQ
jgi:hypothetical protein